MSKTIPASQRVPEGVPTANTTTHEDFVWSCKSTGSETQTLYFRFNSGIWGFIQIAWGYIAVSPTIQSNAMFYVPGDGNAFETHNGHKLKIAKDGVSSDVHGVSMKWDENMEKLIVDYTIGKKYNIKGHFVFERTDHGFKIGDGKNIVGPGTVQHSFYPCGKVKANMIIKGKPYEETGTGFYIHAMSADIMPYNVGQEWSFTDFVSDDKANPTTFQLLQYITPARFGGTLCTQAGLQIDGKNYAVFWDNNVKLEDNVKDNKSGYQIPKQIIYEANGEILKDKKKIKVTMDCRPDVFLQRIDVLYELPYFVKIAVQTLITNPFIFQWLELKSTMKIEVEGEPEKVLTGSSFHELTLMK
ncbi:putative cell survival pathways protein [Mycoemilia scoparia]|uniref:Cell survival pathways protein n=1 Tax=Mycoemilia scoparia TaxID=417184 RepID=A0A9W7ZSZ4_9FUNG|nr:putative cell survival pathways protein [Mycoemilia scoparia]